MAHVNFEIPVTVRSLLEESYERYYVKEIVQPKQLQQHLKEAKQLFKEEGVEYVFTYFDTYISAIINISQLSKDVQTIALEDIHRAMKELNRSVTFLLSDKESLNDELKVKYVSVIKMVIYAYINMVMAVMDKDSSKGLSKRSKKSTDEFANVSRKDVVYEINTILQQEIKLFWDPPVVEEPMINLIAEVCYNFIEKNQTIKSDKELCTYIFHIFGVLITEYRYGTQFIYRMAETAKSHEHAVTVISEGIKLLVESYNARSLVRKFVQQITEWQSDERYQNAEGARNCAHVLSEMAKLMPELMVEEVNYLTEYLSNESYTLRIAVLNVITEVILTTLNKPDLTDDERDARDDFLEVTLEHMLDVSAFVRVKVIQNLIRLQKENVLTRKMQIQVLDDVTFRLRDKGSNVRKIAVNCITSFLEHNPFGSELKLSITEETLAREKLKCEELQERTFGTHMQKVKEGEEAWNKIKEDVMKMMENNVNDDNEDENEEFDLPKDQIANIVKTYLQEKKYEDAYKITKKAVAHIEDYTALRDTIEHANENEFLLKLMSSFYMDIHGQLLHLMEKGNEDNKIINEQQELVIYYEGAVTFLKVIEKAIDPIKDLLESVNISEAQEAVEFFTASYKFNIDNAVHGILEMLKIMQRPESDRRLAVTNALKTIFLETNASSMKEHSQTVVDRLIKFMEIIPFDKIDSFRLVIISWVNEGTLDNNIIECAYRYFVKKEDVSDEISLKAVQLLTMIASAKKSIVMKNLGMITELIFEKRGVDDMLILSETCKLITAGGAEQQLITDTKPPFKVKPDDPMWNHLINILCDQFDSNRPFYNLALKSIIKLIYTLCSNPDQLCEEIIKRVLKKLSLWNKSGTGEIRCCILIRLCLLIGEVAVGELNFLDETIYKEIKRRIHAASNKTNAKHKHKHNSSPRTDFSTASSSRRNATNSIADDGDDSVLDGAQAVDEEAEFILNVLENNIVTSPTSLGVFAPFIEEICKYPNRFDDEHLQCAALSALLKYMLVSSKCCASQIRLVFTTLEKSKYPEVKCTIIIFIGDLLERFPNIIEPWSEHLYSRLNDTDEKVQKTAFHTLANLLLRDMLLVKSYIGSMAIFISEENNDLSNMSKTFFSALAAKNSHHLYNVLPDIFSHLVTKDHEEEHFRYSMKYLFDLIKSAKHAENLVERLCIKFMSTQDEDVCKNIAYCLSLLEYNERAVRKFSEHFHCYKHVLHNRDVYALIKQIMNSWSKIVKTDIKAVVAELEDKISTVFQTSENESGDRNDRSPTEPRSTFKKPKRPVPKSRKKQRKRNNSDSDDEDNDASLNSSATRKSNRTRKAADNSMTYS